MTRRSSRKPRTSRRVIDIRAPKKGTVIVAGVLYITGLFSYLGWLPIMIREDLAVGMLAVAGGLLILGSLLRDL
ncbi:MAG: hypothetical protein JXD18_01545 [Anaerolineae bacterium]|nr:hypothetical protein [Anaerolineae bacterium]